MQFILSKVEFISGVKFWFYKKTAFSYKAANLEDVREA